MVTVANPVAGACRKADDPRNAPLAGDAILRIGFLIISLVWLTATASKADAAGAAHPFDPVLAVDVSYWSGYISESEVACWQDNGVRHVIAGTQNLDIARQQFETAVTGV